MENQNLSKKPLFNLSKVLLETGIKADTLRAWERRYELPVPSRTEGGHRLFSAYDIGTIKWLQAQQDEGMRISQAVDYWRELIAAGVDPLEPIPIIEPVSASVAVQDEIMLPLESLREQWIEAALNYDQEKASRLLDAAFSQYPWEVLGEELIFIGLSKIGKRWYEGDISVQQEHFASELVIRKISALIDDAPATLHPQKVLLGSPPGELHTIALSYIHLLLRYRGWDVTYLGANVPLDKLNESIEALHPSLVIMTATRLKTTPALLDVSRLLADQNIPLAFGGHVFNQIPELPERIPGIYLGDDLMAAMVLIEKTLSTIQTIEKIKEFPNPYGDLGEKLESRLPFLETAAFDITAKEHAQNIPSVVIQDANQFFFQDLIAALKLGDLNFLEPNINWIQGLLGFRNYPPNLFFTYLSSFSRACADQLGSQAEPIVQWFSKLRDSA